MPVKYNCCLSRFLVRVCGSGILAVLLSGFCLAAEYAPRMVPAGGPDTLSAFNWAHSLTDAVAPDELFLERLLGMLTNPATGMRLVERGPEEGADRIREFTRVTDPIKLWHIYGYADERQLCGMFVALWEASARGRGRLVTFGDSPHCWVELQSFHPEQSGGRPAGGQPAGDRKTETEWRAIDVARRIRLKQSIGTATPTERAAVLAAWKAAASSGADTPESVAKLFERLSQLEPKVHYDAVVTGHTADLVLRRGARFIRYAEPQGKRWAMSSLESRDKTWLKELEATPAGPKLAGQPLVGHAQWIYQPDLTSPEHLADGAISLVNVQATPEGLTVQQPGPGSVIFEMHSPFPLVPELGKLDDPKDDAGAAVIDVEATGVTLSYSLDNAATWLTLETKTSPAQLDLTTLASGRYGYLLRAEFAGAPGKSLLKSLKFTNWLQVAPRSWWPGTAEQPPLVLARHDEFGLTTRSYVHHIESSDENSLLAPVIRPPLDFQPGSAQQRIIGPFTMRVAAPLGSQLAWYRVGGQFATGAMSAEGTATGGTATSAPGVEIGVTVGQPRDFVAEAVPSLPPGHGGGDRQLDRTFVLPEPGGSAYVRMVGRPAMNGVRLRVFGLEDRPASPWHMRWQWTTAGEVHEAETDISPETTSLTCPVPALAKIQRLEWHCP